MNKGKKIERKYRINIYFICFYFHLSRIIDLFLYSSFHLLLIFAGQCRRGGELRQMVTPVRRFQGLAGNFAAGNASSAGPSNINNSCRSIVARSTTTSARTHNNENRSSSSSLSAAQLAQLNNIPK